MLFSSPEFFLFFGAYFLLHLLVPVRFRIALIIVGSTVFYAYWNPAYVWVPFLLLALGFYGTLWITAGKHVASRRIRFWLTIASLLLPLVIVKYANFLCRDVFGALFGNPGAVWEISLPLGISFVTFTMIAYVVDVFRGNFPVVRKLSTLGGLVLFFPHLIAGPILRPHDLIPQLTHPRPSTRWLRVIAPYGIAIFTVGLAKKLVFADQIAATVEAVFDNGDAALTSLEYLLGVYGFAMQIYCDFSGYTDMAIGAALLLGIRLPINFRSPYVAASVPEFWRRWHITLSHWLRDYLYVPLGGNRRGYAKEMANVFVTMILGGLWHGANWTFVMWGLFHGVGIAWGHFLRHLGVIRATMPLPRWLAVLLTFHFICAGWIIFRARDMETVSRVFRGLMAANTGSMIDFVYAHLFAIFLLLFFFATHRWDHHRAIRRFVSTTPRAVLIPVLVFSWLVSIAVSAGNSGKFIYFDF